MTDDKNIILVSWDSVRADHLPMYGYDRNTTPYLSKIAADGLLFEDAQVPAVGTPASFTGMFTGEHGSGSMEEPNPKHWQKANEDRAMLPEILSDEGYYTGGFHYNALMSGHFGWDRGWDEYEDHLWVEDNDTESGWRSKLYDTLDELGIANFVVDLKRTVQGELPARWEAMWDDIREFIKNAPEPFFLWVLLIDTHHPWYAPPEYHEWDQPGIRTTYALNYAMRRYRNLVGERRPSIVNAYDNTIRYADEFVRRLETELEEHGHGDDPLIVHSDHGDELGEHGNYGHRPLMYDTVTRVPLVMENVGETGWVSGPTTLLDLGSTILNLAGSDHRIADRPSLLGDERVDRDYVTVQNILDSDRRIAAAVGEEWKVLYHPEGDWGAKPFPEDSWEAYYRPDDQLERENRWGDHPEFLEEALRNQLSGKVTAVDGDDEMTQETRERLRELGYIE